jgi:hypothetical protein
MTMANTETALTAAAGRIRETAKWITISLAAIGTAALAGSQLSSLGSLETGSQRFYLAVAGSAAAGVAAVVALVATAWVATAPAVSLQAIINNRPRGARKADDPALRGGFASVGDLCLARDNALRAERQALDDYYGPPLVPDAETTAKAASARATAVNNVAVPLAQVASYGVVAFRWKVAVGALAYAAILGGAGLGAFVWAANPPDDAAASHAQANILATPEARKMTLNTAGKTALGAKLGSKCQTGAAISVLVLGTTEPGPDVLVQQPDCTELRLVLTRKWGTVS